MTDEITKPGQTGTGSSRGAPADATPDTEETGTSASISVGARTDSSAAIPAGGEANRSGSGGSGGSADPDEEGSTGATMDELLER